MPVVVTANIPAIRRPCKRERTPIVETFVAGPVSRKASAAPGDTPAPISTATSGVAPLAQT